MADEIIRLDYSAEDIGDNIDEVRTARGTFDTLDDRLDNIEGGGPSPSDPIASNCVSPMTGYSKSSSSTPGNISTSDTLNAAIGKLEKRTELNENNILSKATRYILDEGNVNTNTKTFDVSNMPNGMYMITHARFTGATTKIGVSVYMFYLLNGEIDNFTEIKAVTGATISSITATNNTATITYGDNGYHEATALYLYKN